VWVFGVCLYFCFGGVCLVFLDLWGCLWTLFLVGGFC
jgi:hypothetical protein